MRGLRKDSRFIVSKGRPTLIPSTKSVIVGTSPAPGDSYPYIPNALVKPVNRSAAHARDARIVQNPGRTFRINEPLGDGPGVHLPAPPPLDDATAALIARLRRSKRTRLYAEAAWP
jgi:hypothetical protein